MAFEMSFNRRLDRLKAAANMRFSNSPPDALTQSLMETADELVPPDGVHSYFERLDMAMVELGRELDAL